MFGADLSALEDSTKQHYIYFYDPDYVTQMRVPGFDPHLDISVLGELMSEKQSNRYKELDKKESLTHEEKIEFLELKTIRGVGKTTNFAATYGASPTKIAETANQPLAIGKKLYDTYWKRNWAVKQTSKNVTIKIVYNKKWLYNPTSGFWYFLKNEKDNFSVLNQSTGAYVFDSWLRKVKLKVNPIGIHIVLQYHDELLGICLKFQKEIVEKLIADAIKEANKELKLNVEIKNSISWGQNYANCH